MKQFLSILTFCFLSTLAFAQTDTAQHIISGRKNSIEQQKKPYVILISVDGFRYDYAQKYQAKNLLALSESGVRAASMIPSYPSITFPNHYTIATGLYPAHQGLVSNRFYDRNFKQFYSYKSKTATEGKWYGGTPLWVLAEQQNMLTASFYWVGSEAPVKGIYPTYYYNYNEKINIDARINAVVNWLKLPAERRPHLITFYFPEVDHAGHTFGPDAPETERAVHFIDSAIFQLNQAVKSTGLDVSFILVSDHGMTKIDNEHPITIPAAADTAKFIISGEDVLLELYAKDPSTVKSTYKTLKKEAKDYKVYLSSKVPKRWHYSKADDKYNRIGDILLVPAWPKVFLMGHKPNPGTHGYDPHLVREMQATFYAWGPAFKEHLKIPAFQNINVYPVVSSILGLNQTEKIDGNSKLARKIISTKNK